jgi:hypothetical protein
MQVAQQNDNREEIPDKPAGHNSLRYQFCVAMVSPAEGARSGVRVFFPLVTAAVTVVTAVAR